MWSGYGSGFDDFGQETSWFELFESFCNGENGHGGGDKCVEEEEKKKKAEICRTEEEEDKKGKDETCRREEEKVIFRSSSKPSDLSREMISKYFYLPITQAAKELNVGLTRLKKRCRELGIERWPHRKLASLETLINNVKEMTGEEGRAGNNRDAIVKLEMEKKRVEEGPNIELESSTRRLRQHCFKDRYKKKRRLMTDTAMLSYQSPSSSNINDSSTFTNVSGSDSSYDDHLVYR